MGSVCCKEEPVDLLSEVELSHFVLLRSVGKGAFGKVRVVQHKGTQKLYALKYINKEKCIQMKAVENIISERRLLEHIDHSLIVNLRYAFQDDENLFMVLDLMLGGDLRFHLEMMGALPESYVQFYAAEIALTLNYLHSKKIIHRDIKPDNILLDKKGHAHLTDFNVAIQLGNRNTKPLTSVTGNWWSLGISLYELLYGRRPFQGKTNEELQRSILYDSIEFPKEVNVSSDAINFIKELLQRDIHERIGVGESGFEKLKNHPWLKDMCWDILASKVLNAPFVPDETKSNFDPTHELEEVLLEDNPLKVKKRIGKFPKKSISNHELAIMAMEDGFPEKMLLEEKFLTYDYTKPNGARLYSTDENYHPSKTSTSTLIGASSSHLDKPKSVHTA
ncbi:hypothetical protein G6F57_000769 [Rhizopus arrhizus]|uniref:non-specific serine/threonine protein kinase n=1 Tax=Rhizopus oryzae TaxID=64495 RepID=A0A9P6XIR6_RHIOR|nr:hypothetical protein G6F23_000956 [Rhizopus arrhizus]KAG1428481.1 hypothetical protein G6F58_000540 [Rhizopus delemar]KAG0769459.1 hypothetical protein G6F24_001054 [Rhizopus arrhizus]KAG0796309.1 hypothetical protein G6F21_001412 [Rhizopus arrhizus]KAG0802156.1 hypothetical protein G6F22_000540 [Rhizopus arrhizus]